MKYTKHLAIVLIMIYHKITLIILHLSILINNNVIISNFTSNI